MSRDPSVKAYLEKRDEIQQEKKRKEKKRQQNQLRKIAVFGSFFFFVDSWRHINWRFATLYHATFLSPSFLACKRNFQSFLLQGFQQHP